MVCVNTEKVEFLFQYVIFHTVASIFNSVGARFCIIHIILTDGSRGLPPHMCLVTARYAAQSNQFCNTRGVCVKRPSSVSGLNG